MSYYRERRYVGRIVLADGTPRQFTIYAFNKAEARATLARQAREAVGEAAWRAATVYGVERQATHTTKDGTR